MAALALPYDAHPAFRIESERVEVSAERVAQLAAAYERAERGDASAGEVAQHALAAIFSELAQHPEPGFRAFAMELGTLCAGLLAADLAHFAARRVRPLEDERARALERDRYFVGALTPPARAEIADLVAASVVELRARAAAGKLAREELSINAGPVVSRVIRAVHADFARQGIADAVSAYAGRTMRVTGVALELSVPSARWWRDQYATGAAPATLYAHTDEGIAHPKSIVYLSDVTQASGPMSVYPRCEEALALTPLQRIVGRVINSVGQHAALREAYARPDGARVFSSPAFRRHFAALPAALRYNSHIGWDVLPGSELERALVLAERPMLGPAGTAIVFDGARLLHRGGMVQHGDRVALQVVFSAPASRFASVLGDLARARDVARRGELGRELRTLRARAGAAVRRLSPEPHQRLQRRVAKLLPSLACIDIGASYYPHPPWDVFRASPRTTWVAVEPNAKNTAYLDTWAYAASPRLVPTGLSEHGGEQTLYVTATDSGSSLLPPVIGPDMDHRVFDRGYFFPVTEKRIATRSLDDVIAEVAPEAERPLVLKLDTQGTELAILRGATAAFAAERIVGIETEASMLANPVMQGSGKFWEVCRFLEERGFELLQLKPIEGGPFHPERKLAHRSYVNECDAVFCLTRSQLARRPVAHQLAALGFYLSYHLYAELRSLLDVIPGIASACAEAGVNLDQLRALLDQ